ncbi:monofunctional biosynthetic peptidoglycan transglycosylase [Pelobium manganitolerans]|uniref:Biosynthetic peptidoglycan transglycosylase n=1 Tax=Pelobium manganitolerans TaxID=1842495 RepID=A0A419S8J2_9SPHI|nr:monofunctional biosynthetic peptidoglycan transglycosylase [Pelobium manganitolerans]RKD18247.1 monofunctional biosynthetic peptidoglycan transglycosylase [Pelobium manganitolerans]
MPKSKKHNTLGQRLAKWMLKILLYFLGITLGWVLLYKFINPPITYLMVQRGFERKADGKSFKIDKQWLSFDELSNNLKKAAIAGEDANFMQHNGFDFEAMQKAFKKNQKSKKLRGGSTISQQTAKNVFLWPGRSYIRKGFEAYFTFLIELCWSKNRILEVYLNVIEMGDGVYGAEKACQKYYGKSASSLSKAQAALLIAVLPNPRKWSPAKPTNYLSHRQYLILRNMRNLGKIEF